MRFIRSKDSRTGAGPSPADVAVVIPVRDDADALPATLARLAPVAEVVVVDDGSADPGAVARAVARAIGDVATEPGTTPAVRVVRHDRSRGPGAARATGVAASAAPFVVFVDADVRLDAGHLLQGVYTWPRSRRQGVGAAGVASLCKAAFAEAADHVQLSVVQGNTAARDLYARLGFRPHATLRTILFL